MEVTDAMKKTGIILVAVLILLLVLVNSAYTVEENQFACTVRFSEIIGTASICNFYFCNN